MIFKKGRVVIFIFVTGIGIVMGIFGSRFFGFGMIIGSLIHLVGGTVKDNI